MLGEIEFLFVRALASSKTTSNKADATTDEGSLQLPHQTSMAPCSESLYVAPEILFIGKGHRSLSRRSETLSSA